MIAKLINGRRTAARPRTQLRTNRPLAPQLPASPPPSRPLSRQRGPRFCSFEDQKRHYRGPRCEVFQVTDRLPGLRAVSSDRTGPEPPIAHGTSTRRRTAATWTKITPSQNGSPVRGNRNPHGAVRGKQPFEAWHVIAHRIDLGDIMRVFRPPAHYLCRANAF